MASNLLGNFNMEKLNVFANASKMFFPKKMVGIDIGTSSIKVVEVSRWGQGKTLENSINPWVYSFLMMRMIRP